MTPVNLPYLWLPVFRGRQYAYYRRAGQRVRITTGDGKPLTPGDAGFVAAYQHIHATFERPGAEKPSAGSVADIIAAYLASGEYLQLEPDTRTNYRRYLDDIRKRAGNLPAASMPRAFVVQIRDKHAATPAKANRIVTVIKLLYAWAITSDRWRAIKTNPADKVKMLKTGPGYRAWTSAEVASFREHASPHMRLAMMLAVCTGLRRGDCVRLPRSAYSGGVIEVVTSKRGVPVCITAHRDLVAEIAASAPHDATTILVSPSGRPWRGDTFSRAFAAEVKRIGLPAGCTFHGLRKTAGKYLAEAGCSAHEIQAVLGCSLENAEYYCREASRRTLAASAVAKLERRKE